MAERKCIDPRNVVQSDGKATCPDRFFKAYIDKPDCGSCPKASITGRLYLGRTVPAGEIITETIYMRNLINDSGGRRSPRN